MRKSIWICEIDSDFRQLQYRLLTLRLPNHKMRLLLHPALQGIYVQFPSTLVRSFHPLVKQQADNPLDTSIRLDPTLLTGLNPPVLVNNPPQPSGLRPPCSPTPFPQCVHSLSASLRPGMLPMMVSGPKPNRSLVASLEEFHMRLKIHLQPRTQKFRLVIRNPMNLAMSVLYLGLQTSALVLQRGGRL